MHAGRDQLDATSSHLPVPDYTQGLQSADSFAGRPLQGQRIGVIQETVGQGVSAGVNAAFDRAAKHLESLGAEVGEVQLLGILDVSFLEWGVVHAIAAVIEVVLRYLTEEQSTWRAWEHKGVASGTSASVISGIEISGV